MPDSDVSLRGSRVQALYCSVYNNVPYVVIYYCQPRAAAHCVLVCARLFHLIIRLHGFIVFLSLYLRIDVLIY